MCLKFTSPGMAGVPDRLVLLPLGRVVFVELKAPVNKLRPLQKKRKKQLEKLGFKVYVIDSYEGIEDFLQEVIK
ncbi:VRR-NUC domain-containing protein [Alkaliphilus peptidifermentans]|nr:VRR-NUC domain-containing protein [Alkaliphilus peptidifermentans]